MADISERVMFPDRGVKVALGKVYHPLAFCSTRPRNMMPAHMYSADDPAAAKNVAKQEAHKAKVRMDLSMAAFLVPSCLR